MSCLKSTHISLVLLLSTYKFNWISWSTYSSNNNVQSSIWIVCCHNNFLYYIYIHNNNNNNFLINGLMFLTNDINYTWNKLVWKLKYSNHAISIWIWRTWDIVITFTSLVNISSILQYLHIIWCITKLKNQKTATFQTNLMKLLVDKLIKQYLYTLIYTQYFQTMTMM